MASHPKGATRPRARGAYWKCCCYSCWCLARNAAGYTHGFLPPPPRVQALEEEMWTALARANPLFVPWLLHAQDLSDEAAYLEGVSSYRRRLYRQR